MNNSNSIYTEKEQKILNESKTLNILKIRKNISIIFSLIFVYNIIQDIFNVITKYKSQKSIDSFIVILIIDFIILIYFSKKIIQYSIIIIKYNQINDVTTNPLATVCKEKINKCKTLLNNKENYYVVKNSYIELRDFLANYKDLLPTKTYDNAQKELEFIGNEMINCDSKR